MSYDAVILNLYLMYRLLTFLDVLAPRKLKFSIYGDDTETIFGKI